MDERFDDMPPFDAAGMSSTLGMGPADTAFKALAGVKSYQQLLHGLVPGAVGGPPPIRPAIIARVKAVHVRTFRLDSPRACAAYSKLKLKLVDGVVAQRLAVLYNYTTFSPEQAVHVCIVEWIEYELRKDPVPKLKPGEKDMRDGLPPLGDSTRTARRPRRVAKPTTEKPVRKPRKRNAPARSKKSS